jgi:hypothetical protein
MIGRRANATIDSGATLVFGYLNDFVCHLRGDVVMTMIWMYVNILNVYGIVILEDVSCEPLIGFDDMLTFAFGDILAIEAAQGDSFVKAE